MRPAIILSVLDQAFALSCACKSALDATIAIACSDDLSRSLTQMDQPFGCHICSLLHLIFVDHCYFVN